MVPTPRYQSVRGNFDVDVAFQSIFGQSYEDVTAAGLVVWNYFRNINSSTALKDLDPILNVELIVAPLTEQEPVRQFIATESITAPLELIPLLAPRDRMSRRLVAAASEAAAHRFGQWPIRLSKLRHSSLRRSGLACFIDLPSSTENKAIASSSTPSSQSSCSRIRKGIISLSVSKRDARIFGELEYRVGKRRLDSSDVIVVEGRTAIFFDVCNKRLNTELSLNAADLDSMRADIDSMILDQAEATRWPHC